MALGVNSRNDKLNFGRSTRVHTMTRPPPGQCRNSVRSWIYRPDQTCVPQSVRYQPPLAAVHTPTKVLHTRYFYSRLKWLR